jgi:PPM family protein phosphatase
VTSSSGVQVAALSDVGMRRTTNQDSYALLLADSPSALQDRGHLFVVADGMGAHAAGELASKLAADGVPHLYHKYRELSPPEALRRAITETNTEINRRGMANPDFHNMGTTISVLVLLPQGALTAQVGDSRIYRLRDNNVSQLTFDHSLQWELRASGQLPENADISSIVPKNVITRSLGPNPVVQIDLEGPHAIVQGDVYLLCSDGLTGRVEDVELGAILASIEPAEAAQSLIDLANLRGGPDNTTVLVGKIVGSQFASSETTMRPLRIGGVASTTAPVQTAFWIVAIVCLLAAVVLGITMEPPFRLIAAGIATAFALLAGIAGLVLRFGGFGQGIAVGQKRMLGQGPYSSVDCTPSSELVQKLSETVEELRDAARDGAWTIDWGALDDCCQRASKASEGQQFTEATRHYCRGISLVMRQLRSQHVKKGADSAI